MDIIYIGYAVSSDIAGSLKGTSVAGNKMQLNILERLSKYPDTHLHVITLYPILPYPKDKKIFFRQKKIHLFGKTDSVCVEFLNIPAIKQLYQIINLYRKAAKLLSNHPDAVILTYNIYPQIGIPVIRLKKRFHCLTVTLLADPPIDVIQRNCISRIFRSLYYRKAEQCLKKVDRLVAVNEHSIELFAPKAKYIVVEGGVDIREYSFVGKKVTKSSEKIIVYSGALIEYNGIHEMLEAMENVINKEIKLHIYGTGPLEDLVKHHCEHMENCVYFGSVDNVTMLKRQSEAFLLLNPRRTEDLISQVTFPSKLFEYMMSGTPILTTRLNGFSPDYFDKMFFIEKSDPNLLTEAIDKIAIMDQLQLSTIAQKARKFVVQTKGWDWQTDRIYHFINA